MQKLNELKESLAKEKGYKTWTECINDHPNCMVETLMDIIALRLSGLINWVACDKELPLNRRVLARLVLKNVESTIIVGYSAENGWMSKGEKFTQNQITHWAELPKPPCI